MQQRENSTGNSLASGSVGTWELVFQGLGQITPITILAGLIISIVSFSLQVAPLVMVISFLAVFMAANTIYQFSGIVAHAGGYYAYVEYGMGSLMGKFTGLQYLLYQTANLGLELLLVIWGFSKSLNYAFGTSLPIWTGIIWMGGMVVLSYIMMVKGVRPSLKLALILGGIQVAFVIILSLIIIPLAPDNTVSTFIPSVATGGWTGVFLGFIVGGYLAFAGYGSIVPMGEEARAPRKTIGKAIIMVIIMAGAVFILGSYAMVVGYGIPSIQTFAQQVIPGLIVTRRFVGIVGAVTFILINTFLSTYGTVVGMGTPLSRVFFALSRDGLISTKLSKVNNHGTPITAINVTYIVTILVAVTMGSIFYLKYGFYIGIYYAWVIFGTIATLATLLIHILSNTSLSVAKATKLRNKHILTWLIIPTITTILMAVAYYYSLLGITMPFLVAPIIFLGWILISIIIIFTRRKKLKSIVFDEEIV